MRPNTNKRGDTTRYPLFYFALRAAETRKIKCNADERCHRRLDGGEPLSAPMGADANESLPEYHLPMESLIQ